MACWPTRTKQAGRRQEQKERPTPFQKTRSKWARTTSVERRALKTHPARGGGGRRVEEVSKEQAELDCRNPKGRASGGTQCSGGSMGGGNKSRWIG